MREAGRITRDDLEYLKRVAAPAPAFAGAGAAVPTAPPRRRRPPLPSFMRGTTTGCDRRGPREETIPFTRVRKVIAENMIKAKHTAAHTHCFDECDMSAIVALRREWAPKLEAQGIKLTYMPFFIKAAVFALKEFPWVNGSVSPQGDAMIVKHYYNIGMAVGRDDKGLIVPNLKDCDRKNLVQLAHGWPRRPRARRQARSDDIRAALSPSQCRRVRGHQLGAGDQRAGSHARSSSGGGEAVNRGGRDERLHRFDHRVVDGELAVRFLRRVCELLERPELLATPDVVVFL